MDMTHSNLALPTIIVDFVPVFWEPFHGTGERVVALIAVKPNQESKFLARSVAYVTLSQKRLIAMLGQHRGSSAFGILQQSASLLTYRLDAGLNLEDAIPPFEGFSVGKIRRSSGWHMDQVLHAAVNSVSAFSSTEDIFADEPEDARHIATTRNFLTALRNRIVSEDKSLKDRFNRRLSLGNVPDITIDYCHKDLLVQVTSLPASRQQELQLQREAESKLAELNVAVRRMDQNKSTPKLLVNAEVLDWQISDESRKLAGDLLNRFRYFAAQFDAELVTANSANQAAKLLRGFEHT